MGLRYNVNRIHSNLISWFGDVKIEEKTNHKFGNYVEIVASKNDRDVKIVISKTDLENETFNWSYYANPMSESSDLVERTSNVDSIHEDISDIIKNNRFNKEYLELLKNENI